MLIEDEALEASLDAAEQTGHWLTPSEARSLEWPLHFHVWLACSVCALIPMKTAPQPEQGMRAFDLPGVGCG